jgi:hypothetical protein
LPSTHFCHTPWSSTKKRQKNGIFYVGVNMVRMILLKWRGNHGIAIGAAIDDLPCHHQPTPTPKLITPLPPVNTGMGTPRRRWEKGSTPKKTHPPPPCTTRSLRRQRMQPSKASSSQAIHYRYRSRSLIQWLYLRHRFINPYLSQDPPPKPTLQSNHNTS